MRTLRKSPTGIPGFDTITMGGLPTGRPSLVCGGPGSGKTLFALNFLVSGATLFDESGVFFSFEEQTEDLAVNSASLGYDLGALISAGRLAIDHVHIGPDEIEDTGAYDLEGLFVRLGHAVDSISAKRVVIDTIESLFLGLPNLALARAEMRRLFHWLKDRGLTAVITGERGKGELTRFGLEEYVSDCVILLDNRVEEHVATRSLRIVKYRGSLHGGNEYPFLIDAQGISVLPATSSVPMPEVSSEIISTGISGLDAMLRNGGFFVDRASCSQAVPARARRSLPATSSTRPANTENAACSSCSRKVPKKSLGTRFASDSIWASGWQPGCCVSR
jgi:circadian clock protein KaiC